MQLWWCVVCLQFWWDKEQVEKENRGGCMRTLERVQWVTVHHYQCGGCAMWIGRNGVHCQASRAMRRVTCGACVLYWTNHSAAGKNQLKSGRGLKMCICSSFAHCGVEKRGYQLTMPWQFCLVEKLCCFRHCFVVTTQTLTNYTTFFSHYELVNSWGFGLFQIKEIHIRTCYGLK